MPRVSLFYIFYFLTCVSCLAVWHRIVVWNVKECNRITVTSEPLQLFLNHIFRTISCYFLSPWFERHIKSIVQAQERNATTKERLKCHCVSILTLKNWNTVSISRRRKMKTISFPGKLLYFSFKQLSYRLLFEKTFTVHICVCYWYFIRSWKNENILFQHGYQWLMDKCCHICVGFNVKYDVEHLVSYWG